VLQILNVSFLMVLELIIELLLHFLRPLFSYHHVLVLRLYFRRVVLLMGFYFLHFK
jgi:hypothetical protein